MFFFQIRVGFAFRKQKPGISYLESKIRHNFGQIFFFFFKGMEGWVGGHRPIVFKRSSPHKKYHSKGHVMI